MARAHQAGVQARARRRGRDRASRFQSAPRPKGPAVTGPVPLQSPTKVPTSRSSLRQLLNRARRASLARKVAALGGLVTALVVFSALWALSIETRRSTRILFADELSRHQRTLLQLQRQNLTQLISSA